jgi:TrmH family RNA methyltransferase
MLSKKVLKDIQSLSLKKNRDETGLFVAEGPKIVEELLMLLPANVKSIYATEHWAKGRSGVEVVTEDELQKLSSLKTSNSVVAVFQKLQSRPPDIAGFILYLDAIQDPGNFGTILRIADWFGINDVVCSAGCADLYNPKVVQSTMASIARVNVFVDKTDDWLQQQTVPILAASLHGENIYEAPKMKSGILMIGNESKGIRKEFLQMATKLVTIPRRGEAESLNAAVATGILLSHLVPVS